MVKTISRAESYTMRKMLVDYTRHMTLYPDNLLMRILGLFRLKLNNDKWDLIIIQNIFGTSHGIHERFDLKGIHVCLFPCALPACLPWPLHIEPSKGYSY